MQEHERSQLEKALWQQLTQGLPICGWKYLWVKD